MIQQTIRVMANDTDFTQRIHYSAIFRYFEQADAEFFQHIGISYKSLYEQGYGAPRVRVECDYLGAIRFGDEVTVRTGIARIGNTSFTYAFHFYIAGDLVAKGSMTIVFIDLTTERPVPIPAHVRAELEKHLQ